MEEVRVRFAPSPTGYLHIGGARTALINWLFAKKHNGKFLLRIEDTDTIRSKDDCVQAIIDSLQWLGLGWDEDITIQSKNISRHTEVAKYLLREGKAYKCYCTTERLSALRDSQIAAKKPPGYDQKCRNLTEDRIGEPHTIRLKVPIAFTEGLAAHKGPPMDHVRDPGGWWH